MPYGQDRWTAGSTPTDFGFTSQRREGFGLYDYQARFYSPRIGRFISPDTIGVRGSDPQTFNRYSYVRNNPISRTDPSGHCDWCKQLWEDIQVWLILHSPCTGMVGGCFTAPKFEPERPNPGEMVGPTLINPEELDGLDAFQEGLELGEQLGRMAPTDVKYSQDIYSPTGIRRDTGEPYSVDDNIRDLSNNPEFELPPIRVFKKEPYMDDWGPKTIGKYSGDPRNLKDGEIYTLDHRRLVAYQEAGRESIPIVWADEQDVYDERFKFSTTNEGTEIFRKN